MRKKNAGWSYSLHTQLTCFQIISKKKDSGKQEQFSHSSTQREDERVGHIVLPHLNLTFDSLNVFFDLAKEMVGPMEQQGVLPGLCQVCCSLAEQPSPWLAGDLRRGGWFDGVVKKEVGEA